MGLSDGEEEEEEEGSKVRFGASCGFREGFGADE